MTRAQMIAETKLLQECDSLHWILRKCDLTENGGQWLDEAEAINRTIARKIKAYRGEFIKNAKRE